MKKTIILLLTVITLFYSCIFTANANENDIAVNLHLSGYTYVSILPEYYANRIGTQNMIHNPYYKKYYNELLAKSYIAYNDLKPHIPENIDSLIQYYTENGAEYVTLIFNSDYAWEVEVSTYIKLVLAGSGFSEEDIIYISDYDCAAVVRITEENRNKLFSIKELVFIGDAFFTQAPFVLEPVLGTYAVGKVVFKDGQQRYDATEVTAADARFILRYSAGLEEVGAVKQFYFCADVNMDNEINANDARKALRIAAGLEDEIYISYSYDQFWYDGI